MTAPTQKAGFFADFGALSALKHDAKADGSKALRATAQQFESLFTEMMLKSMRAAKVGDPASDSNEMDFYQGMFDQQLAVQLSKGRGMGLADMLVQQLTRTGLVPASTSAAASPAAATALDTADKTPTLQPDGVTTPVPGSRTISDASPLGASEDATSVDAPWPPATPEEFVRRLLPHAQAAAKQLGVAATTLVAHAALETGWGKHMPASVDGSSSFNFFGIKAAGSWQGDSVGATTLEYEQGVAVKRVERFRAYDTPAECFSDYASLMNNKRYNGAAQSGNDSAQFASALQRGGYATDPHYATKLNAVAGAVRAIQSGSNSIVTTQVVATQVQPLLADT